MGRETLPAPPRPGTVRGVRKRSWSELPTAARVAIVAGGVVEAALTAVCVVDLVQPSRGATRGPALLWWPALTVQPFGPIAYLAFGRRRPR